MISIGNKMLKAIYLIFPIVILYSIATGCTAIGAFIGESTKTDETTIELNGVDSLDLKSLGIINGGDSIIVFTKGGDSIRGIYSDIQSSSDIIDSDELRNNLKGIYIPELGDTLYMANQGKYEKYEFLGFRYMSIRLGDSNDNIILINLNERKVIMKDDNLIIDEDDIKLNKSYVKFSEYENVLNNYYKSKKRMLAIQNDEGRLEFQICDIDKLVIPANDGDFWTLTIIGASIDIIIATIIYFDYKENGLMGMTIFQ